MGDLKEIKAHCRYSVHRSPYPKGVIWLYEKTFLLVNMTTLRVQCLKTAFRNGTVPSDLVEHVITVTKPLVMKTFDSHCESVVADEYRILINTSYCNTTNEFTNSMDIQFPINLAYLSEYFDLENLYNLRAQTFLNESLEVLLPDLATADKLWDKVMAEETSAKFDMLQTIKTTKHSGEVYDHLAHYLFNQMAKAHYKPGD